MINFSYIHVLLQMALFHSFYSFPDSSVGKESACNAEDPGSIPRSGRSPWEGNGNPLQYSCLENPMDRGAWQATVHGVARVGHDLATLLLLLVFHWGFPREVACNAGDPSLIPGLGSSPLEWIDYPLQYSWASLVAKMVNNPPAMWETWVQSLGWEDPLEKGMIPTPVFLLGEFHWQKSLVGYSPWGSQRVGHGWETNALVYQRMSNE